MPVPSTTLISIITEAFPQAKFENESLIFPHTEIIRFSSKGKKYVGKLIESPFLEQCSSSDRKTHIKFLHHAIPIYYKTLKNIGILVPPFHELYYKDDGIVECSTDLGTDRLDIVLSKRSVDESKELIDTYIKTILPILTASNPTFGFDAAAENFLVGSDGLLHYCDFVPPRIMDGKVPIVGFPQPHDDAGIQSGYDRYFLPYGILRRARIFFLNANIELDKIIFSSLESHLPKETYTHFLTLFHNNPEFLVKNCLENHDLTGAKHIIESTNDTDALREVAARVFWTIKGTATPLDVYDLSRLHTHFTAKEKEIRRQKFKQAIIDVL